MSDFTSVTLTADETTVSMGETVTIVSTGSDSTAVALGAGPRGPQGEPGLQGAPGLPGSAPQSYVHVQGVPATTWTVTHNLGFYPNVTIEDSAGATCEGEIVFNDENTITLIFFSGGFSGRAYLS